MVLGRESHFLKEKKVDFRGKIISLGKESVYFGEKTFLYGKGFFEEKEVVF